MWADLGKKKDFKSLLELTLASSLLFRALPDAKGPEESALFTLELAIEKVFPAKSLKKKADHDPVCSFCGRKPPEVRLGAG
jgi:hypothetical protein